MHALDKEIGELYLEELVNAAYASVRTKPVFWSLQEVWACLAIG